MSLIRWTGDQKKAIEARGSNLLVSAAAGSGKTAVLVERIIRRLIDSGNQVDLDRLLVVTFTDAAAGEMRNRVSAALAAALQEQPSSPLLQRQLFLVPRANIGTLHSFCSEVVRSHFYLHELDPGFRVMDDNEASMLRGEVLEEVLEICYEESQDGPLDVPFLQLSRSLAGRYGDDREVAQLVLRLYDFAHSLPRPVAWLNWLATALDESSITPWEEQPWLDEWREMVRLELENCTADLARAWRLARSTNGLGGYADRLQGDLNGFRELQQLIKGSFEEIKAAVEEMRGWPALPRLGKGEAPEDLKKKVQGLRSGVKKRFTSLYIDLFSRSGEKIIEDIAQAAPLVRAMVELTLKFKEAYRAAKLERAVVDFSDLEHYALSILASNGEGADLGQDRSLGPNEPLLPSPVAEEYRDRFAEVLVDEYQDINGVQEAILALVSRPGHRFLVGDVKQSIYRFRMADPAVFLNLYRQFGGPGACGEGVTGQRIDLQSNFRSRPGVLQSVNFLFERLMNEQVAELAYDERARLNPGTEYPVNETDGETLPVEFHLLEYADLNEGDLTGEQQDEGGEETDDLDLIRLEARWVAGRVRDLVAGGEYRDRDNKGQSDRQVTWRDVVILMRSLKGRVGVYLEEFRRLDIPVYADGSGGYFGATEVQTVVSLLQVIDNPVRDIPLAAVLRSPFVGLDASRLAEIRLASTEGDFYEAVKLAASGESETSPEVSSRLARFLERLEEWRSLASTVSPAELLEELYRQTGYYDLVGGMPGGAVRQANLRALVDRARRFEGTVYRGLFRFLRFLEQVQEGGKDMDAARSLGENEDVVRLMSIHKSKGLEFPVVVVCGLGRGFNFTDLRRNPLLHRRLGCGPVVVDPDKGIRYPTVLHRLIKHRLRLETLAEEMRLLYVALTRARERLLVTGATRELGRLVDNWIDLGQAAPAAGPLEASLLAGARRPLDWLGPTLWSHPELKNFTYGEKSREVNTDCWKLFLWSAPTLEQLRRPLDYGQDREPEIWLQCIERLEPLPEEWQLLKEREWIGEKGKWPDNRELSSRLFWSCPYSELAGLPSKVTVTEWRHRQEELEENSGEIIAAPVFPRGDTAGELDSPPGFGLPAFYTGTSMDGAERGRVVHLVMQNLELDPPPGESGVRDQLNTMVQKQIISPGQRKLVRALEIARIFDTVLGQRILEAARGGRLWREVPFTLGLDAVELYPELAGRIPEKEKILLQGVIDCLIEQEDSLVIIDYKTDRVTTENIQETAERYRVQLELYARAARTILGRPVGEKILYFFALNKQVSV